MDVAVPACCLSLFIAVSVFELITNCEGDTRWRSCATNRKVAGSIPVGVIGIFH
jgi:hypothetical protein